VQSCQCSHAFVAYSQANFHVKAAPPERPGCRGFAPPEETLEENTGNVPSKESLNEAS